MTLLGCLPVLIVVLLILLLSVIGKGVRFVLSLVRLLGDIVLWAWGSFCNLFLPLRRQRRVYNPLTGNWNIEEPILMDGGKRPSGKADKGAKLYAADDGEYTDFEELPTP